MVGKFRTALQLVTSPRRFVAVVWEKLAGRGPALELRTRGFLDALARGLAGWLRNRDSVSPTQHVVMVVSQLGVPAALATGNFLGAYAGGLRAFGASTVAVGWNQVTRPTMLHEEFGRGAFVWRLARPRHVTHDLLDEATVVAVHFSAVQSLEEIVSLAPTATIVVMCLEHPETTYAGNPQAQRSSIDLTLRYAHGVVVTSEFTRDLWLTEGVASDRLLRVTTAIPSGRFAESPVEEVDDKFLGVYTGNIAFPEALALIRIASAVSAAIPEFRLDVYADATAEQLRNFHHEVQVNGAESIVRLHEAVSASRLQKVQMNAGILLAYQEDWLRTWVGFPSKLGEYFVTGRPVVCCDTPSLKGVAVDRETAYVAPMGDETGFADSVIYALQHPAESARVGIAGRTRIGQVADSKVAAAELLSWLECLPKPDGAS